MRYKTVARLGLGLATALFNASVSAAQSPGRTGEISLDSLLNTRISTASKYLQTSAEAAASVTIVSGDEIRLLGYSDLQEVLESVPGMYVSNDRNYPYLGTRGFGRPSDYNNRILLLIDGHTMNEQVWGGAPIGTDMPINLEAVERIEVVRGPGSALYGTSAMFAVINIVTKSGARQSGTSVSARYGSAMDRQVGATVGYALSRRSSFTVSALANENDGFTLHYPEYASDVHTKGTVRKLDWERRGSILGTLVTGNVTTRFGYRTRTKGVPTGAFEVLFGDARAQTTDGSAWGEVAIRTNPTPAAQLSARLYADQSTYSGVFPYLPEVPRTDRGISTNIGGEVMATWDVATRNRLTLGTEMRRMLKAEYAEASETGVEQGTNAPYTVASLFAQNELELTHNLKLVGGLRFERKLSRWHALAPRFAAVFTPDEKSTFKLLYGEAYRAPSVSESDLETDVYSRNLSLRPERVATYEVVAERRISSALLVGTSAYHYAIRNLIEQTESDTATGIRFENLLAVRGRGVEFTANLQPANGPFTLRAWYNLQRTRDRATGNQLTNSPNHALNLALIARSAGGAHAALSQRHESGRIMKSGEITAEFNRTDLNIGYTVSGATRLTLFRDTDISLRASNLFDSKYSVPAGLEHVQQSIEQNGRTLSLRLRRTF